MPNINTIYNTQTLQSSDLFFQEGNSDKVYHLSLEEVFAESPSESDQPSTQTNQNNNRYIVNFAFGRRGKWLQRDTKTPRPVSRYTAESIFDKVHRSKIAKGYIEG